LFLGQTQKLSLHQLLFGRKYDTKFFGRWFSNGAHDRTEEPQSSDQTTEKSNENSHEQQQQQQQYPRFNAQKGPKGYFSHRFDSIHVLL
jgi:hypothetical protein